MGEPTESTATQNEQHPIHETILEGLKTGAEAGIQGTINGIKDLPENLGKFFDAVYVQPFTGVYEDVKKFFDGAPAEPVGGDQAYLDAVQALKELKPADMETLLKTSAPNPPTDLKAVAVDNQPNNGSNSPDVFGSDSVNGSNPPPVNIQDLLQPPKML